MKEGVLVTGGAGFVGSNLVAKLVEDGERVRVYDDLSRWGTKRNIEWLQEKYGDRIDFRKADIRDFELLREAVDGIGVVFHLAGQVAVTTSVQEPRQDFEINALGTLNMLEAARLSGQNPVVIFTSTNKVYGRMQDIRVKEDKARYRLLDCPDGVSEQRPLDFYSPYGCSKGTADQYVRDYARIYDLPTVVFRMSCVYGPRQFGNEDQGWVAHFLISGMKRAPLTVYGNGKQVRDILHVDDLVSAFKLAVEKIDDVRGRVYNIGGGTGNTLSLLELLKLMRDEYGYEVEPAFADWRPGDQPIYVTDIRKVEKELGWKPVISGRDGVNKLNGWIQANRELF